jgi:hypothetical protein
MSSNTQYKGILEKIPSLETDQSNLPEVVNALVDRINYIYSLVEPDPDPSNWES